MRTTTINIGKDVHRVLKVHCVLSSQQMGLFIEQAIEEKIGREPIVQQ